MDQPKSTSLARDFLVFSMILLLVAFVVSGGYWFYGYQAELQKRHRQLESDAVRISLLLADYINHVGQYTSFLGQRVADSSGSLPQVAQLIGCHEGERFNFITTFDWVTPDKRLRASSCIGVLTQPFDMRDRDYLLRTQAQPWTLQLSAPRYGGISKHWIIPAGMGITDKNGKFLGSVTTGFGISELNYRLKHLLGSDDGPRFIILTEEGQLVLDSAGDNIMPPAVTMPFGKDAPVNHTGGIKPLEFDGYRFGYQEMVPGYPLRVLTGFSTAMPRQLFSAAVLPGLAGLLAAVAAAGVLLYFMRRRLIRPVLQLSQQAESIGSGAPVTIKSSHVKELQMLEEQMQRISSYLTSEKRTSELLVRQTELLRYKTNALKKANTKALEARDAAIKAGQAKGEFLANMSHEIRTPLNAVIGLTRILLMQRHPPQRQKEFLDTIQLSANQLLQLINDLLDLSKIENNQMSLENVSFDLKAIIDEVIAINQIGAQKNNLVLSAQCGLVLPRLMGDPMRLRQVLINLVGNAVKFTQSGSVTVHLDCRLSSINSATHLTISVEDTGVGIAPEKLNEIFGKFSQADASVSRQYGGTGLGLSISKNLVDLMGGTITVKSAPNVGSTFTVTLDLERADYEAPEEMAEGIAENDPRLQGLRILVVEDNPTNVLVIQNLLDMLGCQFDVATSGQAALRRLEQPDYDIVLMDVQMPEMDGYQVTRRLRELEQQEGRRRLHVIGLTAHSLREDREKGLAAGMDDYLPKPFDPKDLIALMQKHLDKPLLREAEESVPGMAWGFE